MESYSNIFDNEISDEKISSWLGQFKDSETGYIKKLLVNFKYYSSKKVNGMVEELHKIILQKTKLSLDKILFAPVGYVAKSGSAIAYFYRMQNNLKEEQFIAASDINEVSLKDMEAVVFLDDIIGSGHQAFEVWKQLLEPLASRNGNTVKFIFATLVGYERGIKYLQENTGYDIEVVESIPESSLLFNSESRIFEENEFEKAKEVLNSYGENLYENFPLGYAKGKGLIGFFYSTPNNTLPIFWSTENNWKPLLARGNSFRDPKYLVGPIHGIPSNIIQNSPTKAIDEILLLDKYDIPPEISVSIFSEFKKAPIFLILAPIIKHLDINPNTFSDILKIITVLKNAKHEKESITTALLITSYKVHQQFDKRGAYVIKSDDTISSDLAKIVAMANFVNGFSGTVVINNVGKVLGTYIYDSSEKIHDPLLPKRYLPAAKFSSNSKGLLFLFAGDNRVSVFNQGKRLLSYRNSSWHYYTSEIENVAEMLSEKHKIVHDVLKRILKIAFQMSDEGKGALICVGDHDNVLKYTDPPKTEHFAIEKINIKTGNDNAIIGLLSQDGGTIFSSEGILIQTMTFIRPPAGTKGYEEIGKGSKHSTASKITTITNTTSIAVSVDGQITIFTNGEVYFKMMG